MADSNPGLCIFCGGRKLTKAHVFAESWTGLFDDPNGPHEHEVVHRHTAPRTGEQRVMKRAKTFALKGRKVCGGCNSGWLNRLEERLTPLMENFAINNHCTLGPERQADLALWASAAMLITMSMDPDATDFADPTLARMIYEAHAPTAGMDIWLGANPHGEMAWVGSHAFDVAESSADRKAWGGTIAFGYAVIHIVCHNVLEQRISLSGDANRSMRRIWGVQERVKWPPKLLLRPRSLRPLAVIVGEQSSFQRAVSRRAA